MSVVFWGSACRQLFARVFVGDVIFLSHFTVNLYTRRSDSLSSESTTPKGEIEFKFNTNNPRGELVVLEEAHGMSMTERASERARTRNSIDRSSYGLQRHKHKRNFRPKQGKRHSSTEWRYCRSWSFARPNSRRCIFSRTTPSSTSWVS